MCVPIFIYEICHTANLKSEVISSAAGNDMYIRIRKVIPYLIL
jgi:hypothetical protein